MDRAKLAQLRKKKAESKSNAHKEILESQDSIKNALLNGLRLPEFDGYEVEWSDDNPTKIKYSLDDKLVATLTLKWDDRKLISAKLT